MKRNLVIAVSREVEVDDNNPDNCDVRCRFYHHAVVSSHPAWCTLDSTIVIMSSMQRTELCKSGEKGWAVNKDAPKGNQ